MPFKLRRVFQTITLALIAAMAFDRSAVAQDYPQRPITLVVGFAAGGFADGFARLIAGPLSEKLGQNVVVENRAGGGGNIAAAMVSKVAPDGYTLLVTTNGMAINQTLTKNKGFDVSDFKTITIPAWAPEVLAVRADHPAKTLADFVQMAKTKSISFASPGVGTSAHIATTYFFKVLTKVDAVHVPFQGGAPAVNAAVGGHVDVLAGAVPGYAGQLESGIIRPLSFASEQRVPEFPAVPTYTESGYPELVATTWVGVFAPRSTSDAIVEKLNRTIDAILREPAVGPRLKTLHMQTTLRDQKASAAYLDEDVARWAKMSRLSGVTGE